MKGKRQTLAKLEPSQIRELVKECLEKGGDIGFRIKGDSPIHSAVYKGDVELVELLLDHCKSAGIDEKNKKRQTPFALALSVGNGF